MSSFIHSPNHFNSIEKGLVRLFTDDRFHSPVELREVSNLLFNKRDYVKRDIEKEISLIMDELRVLNVTCVSLQYSHHFDNVDKEIQEQKAVLLNMKDEYEPLNKISLLKAIDSLYYQIEIEHMLNNNLRSVTMDQRNALKFLMVMSNKLAHDIVLDSKDYESAKWSL